jgi:hypothetical protein
MELDIDEHLRRKKEGKYETGGPSGEGKGSVSIADSSSKSDEDIIGIGMLAVAANAIMNAVTPSDQGGTAIDNSSSADNLGDNFESTSADIQQSESNSANDGGGMSMSMSSSSGDGDGGGGGE